MIKKMWNMENPAWRRILRQSVCGVAFGCAWNVVGVAGAAYCHHALGILPGVALLVGFLATKALSVAAVFATAAVLVRAFVAPAGMPIEKAEYALAFPLAPFWFGFTVFMMTNAVWARMTGLLSVF